MVLAGDARRRGVGNRLADLLLQQEVDPGLGQIDVLLRHRPIRQTLAPPLQHHPRIVHRRHRLIDILLRADHPALELYRLQPQEQLAGLYLHAFFDEDLLDLAGDLGAHRDLLTRLDLAKLGDRDLQIAARHLGEQRRIHRRLLAGPLAHRKDHKPDQCHHSEHPDGDRPPPLFRHSVLLSSR